MNKLDNLFVRIIRNPAICNEYEITDSQRYDSIASGLKSINPYVVAIATILKETNYAYEIQRQDMSIRHKEGPVVLQDNSLKSIYRKIIGILEKTK